MVKRFNPQSVQWSPKSFEPIPVFSDTPELDTITFKQNQTLQSFAQRLGEAEFMRIVRYVAPADADFTGDFNNVLKHKLFTEPGGKTFASDVIALLIEWTKK